MYTVEAKGLRTAATFECPPDYDDTEVLVLAPGLASSEMGRLRKELVALGHAAVSFEQPRASYVRRFGDVGELRARTLEEVARHARVQRGITRSALIGHSLGGVDAIRVAGMAGSSDEVTSLELLACAGLTGESFWQIAMRLGGEGIGEMKKRNLDLVRSTLINGLRNPAQLLCEGRYGQRQIIDELDMLSGEIDSGLLRFRDDAVFPDALLDQRVRRLIDSGKMRGSMAHLTLHACHSAPYCDPKGTAQSVDSLLSLRTLNE